MTWEEAVLWLRQQPDQTELVKQCYFDDPLRTASDRYYKSTEWAAVRSFLPKTRGKALDFAAGRGIATYALVRDGWDVVALEPDPSVFVGAGAIRKLAGDVGLAIDIQEAQGESMPFPDETFDVVFCRQALHHAQDLRGVCREIARVLKSGGSLLAIREHVISRATDLQQFLACHPLHRLYGGENAFTLSEYRSAIWESGMRLHRVLGPRASNINLFPLDVNDLKNQFAKKWRIPLHDQIFRFAMVILDFIDRTPGRLYSFLAQKP